MIITFALILVNTESRCVPDNCSSYKKLGEATIAA